MARAAELLVLLAIAYFIATQVIVPAAVGMPLFPFARYRRKIKKREEVAANNFSQALDAEIERTRAEGAQQPCSTTTETKEQPQPQPGSSLSNASEPSSSASS